MKELTKEQIESLEQEAEEYAEENFEQFPDAGGYTIQDGDYELKQDYFLMGVDWVLNKLKADEKTKT